MLQLDMLVMADDFPPTTEHVLDEAVHILVGVILHMPEPFPCGACHTCHQPIRGYC